MKKQKRWKKGFKQTQDETARKETEERLHRMVHDLVDGALTQMADLMKAASQRSVKIADATARQIPATHEEITGEVLAYLMVGSKLAYVGGMPQKLLLALQQMASTAAYDAKSDELIPITGQLVKIPEGPATIQ